MVTWQVFFISEQLFLGTPFFPEHLQWVLPRITWTLITAENFNNLIVWKMSPPIPSALVIETTLLFLKAKNKLIIQSIEINEN